MRLSRVWILGIVLTCYGYAAEKTTLEVIEAPSQNYIPRGPSMIILHYTEVSLEETLRIFCEQKRVSSHYTVAEDGTIYRHVDETNTARHAGSGDLSHWYRNDVNKPSVGIEIVNLGIRHTDVTQDDSVPGDKVYMGGKTWFRFNSMQIDKIILLARDIIERWKISPENILGHSDVAPQRKDDPGPLFPWLTLAKNGVGITYDPMEKALRWDKDKLYPLVEAPQGWEISWLQDRFRYLGYQVPNSGKVDPETEKVVRAFRMHHMQDYSIEVDSLMVQILLTLIAWKSDYYTPGRLV